VPLKKFFSSAHPKNNRRSLAGFNWMQ